MNSLILTLHSFSSFFPGSRRKHLFSRDKLKLFLKQHCEPQDGVIKIKVMRSEIIYWKEEKKRRNRLKRTSETNTKQMDCILFIIIKEKKSSLEISHCEINKW